MKKQRITSNKLGKQILSFLLCMTLVLSGLMVPAKQVEAEAIKTIAGVGTSIIKNPTAPKSDNDAWKGSYVYYGNYDVDGDGKAEPTKYRVLDTSTTLYSGDGKTKTMLLDCDSVLYEHKFHTYGDGTGWDGSDIKNSLNGNDFLNKDGVFTTTEKNVIIASKIKGHALKDADVGEFYASMLENYIGLNGDQIFLLDYEDVCNESYGYGNQDSGDYYVFREKTSSGSHTSWWWLRTTISPAGNAATYVDDCGYMFFEGHGEKPGASPAFNVDLSSVIFSSIVSGTAGKTGAEYKLTLLDNDMKLAQGSVTKSGNTLTIPYTISGANSENATQVSVLILDKNYTAGNTNGAKVLAYEKLNVSSFSTSGTGTYTIPKSLVGKVEGTDYYVYIVAEDVNGGKETDYASQPSRVSIPRSVPTVGKKVASDDGKANYEITTASGTNVTVTYVAPKNSKATKVVVPDTVVIGGNACKVTAIEKNAFKKNKNIKSVTIGKNVKTIGKSAFEGCKKLTSVTIGKSVTKIGSKAFYGCSKIKTLTIKSTKLTTKKIGSKAFGKTSKSMKVNIPKKKFKAYKSMLVKKGVSKKAKFKKK